MIDLTPITHDAAHGYRNIFGPCRTPEEAFLGYGLAHEDRTTELLRGLSQALATAAERNGPMAENPRIPAGYTYLAQFVMHDMTCNVGSLPGTTRIRIPDTNIRQRALQLDVLYGAGPIHQPILFELGQPPTFARTRLKLGRLRSSSSTHAEPIGMDDIARVTGQCAGRPEPALSFSDVMVPDARNDDNAIVAQLHTLLASLHNAIVARLECAEDGALRSLSGEEVFLVARYLMGTTYRSVLRNDLLSRLLHPNIHQLYSSVDTARCDDTRIPVEFSHAVMRAGHAMVRSSYVLNDDNMFGLASILTSTSRMNPAAMPLSDAWRIDWSYFFPMERTDFINLSRRLSPLVATPLTRDANLDPGATQKRGLQCRDFLRAEPGKIRSVRSCARHVSDGVRNQSRLLSDDVYRFHVIKQYLDEVCSMSPRSPLSSDDINTIAADPPLAFFTLFEAMHEANGESFGTLGSVIAAEVFYKALDIADATWSIECHEFVRAVDVVFVSGVPASMADIVSFVEANAALLGEPAGTSWPRHSLST